MELGVDGNILQDYTLQANSIMKIISDAIDKIEFLSYLPYIMKNDGEILRKFLPKAEVDYILFTYKYGTDMTRGLVEHRPDLCQIYDMLEHIYINMKQADISKKGPFLVDFGDIHVSYAIDRIYQSSDMKNHVQNMGNFEQQPISKVFLEAMRTIKNLASARLKIRAKELMQREALLKTAHRSNQMLSTKIQELQNVLNTQHKKKLQERSCKTAVIDDLNNKIKTVKTNTKGEIEKLVQESEAAMMKDYIKSMEIQTELDAEVKESKQKYESLLEENLRKEKVLRAKRLKVEAQLASWVAKFDNDIGEKQAEFDELDKTYKAEQDDLEALQKKFEEQDIEYCVLMKEKEEEQNRINKENAWIFLQKRSVRTIQRYWREYKIRKLMKKKSKKSKKKGAEKSGSAGSKKEKSAVTDGQKEEKTTLRGGPDPNALLEKKFNSEVLANAQEENAFEPKT